MKKSPIIFHLLLLFCVKSAYRIIGHLIIKFSLSTHSEKDILNYDIKEYNFQYYFNFKIINSPRYIFFIISLFYSLFRYFSNKYNI